MTSSGRGLGRSHAGLLAARGARVIVNDVAGADDAVDEIRKSGGEATASFDDISTPEGAASLVRGAIDAYGTIDILVNNAAIGRFTTMSDATIEEYELVRRVGLDGTFYVTREVWPIMVWTAGMAASSSPPQATASSITRHRSATRSRRQGCTA